MHFWCKIIQWNNSLTHSAVMETDEALQAESNKQRQKRTQRKWFTVQTRLMWTSFLKHFLLWLFLRLYLHQNNNIRSSNTDPTETSPHQAGGVTLWLWKEKPEPRIKDQNLEREITRLGFWLLCYPPPKTVQHPTPHSFFTLIPDLLLFSLWFVVEHWHIGSNWVG